VRTVKVAEGGWVSGGGVLQAGAEGLECGAAYINHAAAAAAAAVPKPRQAKALYLPPTHHHNLALASKLLLDLV